MTSYQYGSMVKEMIEEQASKTKDKKHKKHMLKNTKNK